jgi:transcriptional regulator with XRE-family HTH domain
VNKAAQRRYYKNESFMLAVGQKIRAIRQSKGLSQEALANECGIDYSQINRMELGKVNFSLSYFQLLADALGCDPKDLMP